MPAYHPLVSVSLIGVIPFSSNLIEFQPCDCFMGAAQPSHATVERLRGYKPLADVVFVSTSPVAVTTRR